MKNFGLIIYFIGICTLSAQNKGKITYRIEAIKDSIEQPFENLENSDAKNKALQMFKDSKPVEGYLVFNDSISIYNVEPKIDIPGWNNGSDGLIITRSKLNISWSLAGGNSTYFNDLSRDFTISQNEIMGPTVRVIQKPKEWTLTEKTKVIDGYTCYLATIDKLNNKKLKAWYTPAIPVKHGPKGFNGLPGLILEIEDVIYLWKAIKIDFESPEADDIIEPVDGDLMTKEEFAEFCGNPFAKD
ncbi:GLPGLI family protein [Winogradskyella endarachnes]|uniref:GLPGLI family protein n=1 Tax=Winogradskyella endarachnes TaxID=2681965 RepID=A0A6L6UBT8_9FLAO|nr:GLPGLI family protein [Winogradskyella endarachnes]MUU78996.1 GLPGLI family protein [Winogradskyella endarachnes]